MSATLREFEIIVYGASGFTGRLVAEYIVQTYPDLKWAMAGRSEQKLAQVRDLIGAGANTPLILADSSDPTSLLAMAERTATLITTVGPYQLFGEPVVVACVAKGTDYVDLCGEPAWMHDIIEKYNTEALSSGARIVLSCGFDSLPFDLGVYYLQRHALKTSAAALMQVKGRVRKMQGAFSGGTAASFMQSMQRAKAEPEVMGWLKDPFSLCPDFSGPAQPRGDKPIYDEDLRSWSAPFVMASINTKNIHRSNLLLGHLYGRDFVYDEMVLTGPGEGGEKVAMAIAGDNSMAKNPPKPGEGPSEEERNSGFYDLMFTGLTQDGKRLTVGVTGDKDPGYGSTSKMLTEAGLCLTLDISREQTPGGVYTSAPAMGDALIKRLKENAGLSFNIEG